MTPATHPRPRADAAEWTTLHCSFCGKDADHVRFLAAGASGDAICERCAVVAFFIMVKAYASGVLRLGARHA